MIDAENRGGRPPGRPRRRHPISPSAWPSSWPRPAANPPSSSPSTASRTPTTSAPLPRTPKPPAATVWSSPLRPPLRRRHQVLRRRPRTPPRRRGPQPGPSRRTARDSGIWCIGLDGTANPSLFALDSPTNPSASSSAAKAPASTASSAMPSSASPCPARSKASTPPSPGPWPCSPPQRHQLPLTPLITYLFPRGVAQPAAQLSCKQPIQSGHAPNQPPWSGRL